MKASLKVLPVVTLAPPAPVAQRTEQRFPKPRVGRSSRPRGTFEAKMTYFYMTYVPLERF